MGTDDSQMGRWEAGTFKVEGGMNPGQCRQATLLTTQVGQKLGKHQKVPLTHVGFRQVSIERKVHPESSAPERSAANPIS
jgi:hypothetical protein